MELKTPNTFFKCSCGKDVALAHIDDVRTCTCGKQVEFPECFKRYFIARYVENKKDSEIKIEGLVIRPIKYIKID